MVVRFALRKATTPNARQLSLQKPKSCIYRSLQRNLTRSSHHWLKRLTNARSDAHVMALGQ